MAQPKYIHCFVRRAGRKKPLGRTRGRWKDVKMDLREVRFGGMNRVDVA